MRVKFTKMHGLGNDFVVFDAINQSIDLSADQCRALADRRFGIGCDQILLVENPQSADADFRYRIFNADGGEVEQCGNGARCFARFVHDKGLTDKSEIRVQTLGGLIIPRLQDNGQVTVNMGVPRFAPAEVPFETEEQATTYTLIIEDRSVEVSVLSMGNPHAVQIVDDIDTAPVAEQGPIIENHPRFPKRVNAGFMQILDPGHAAVRVFERGAGETLACGTGACAAVAAGRQLELLDETVHVRLRGGELTIQWAGAGNPVWMTGPATTVFDGEIDLAKS
ncbi:MAG: diaminopimelate epimerase [Gammaproteobacteria bacterium]|nr:diaminopimelate epimerase [Gammaproteobacteria bacterium]